MFENIDSYLVQLATQLKGSDRALIQDALSDAEEFLSAALEKIREEQPERDAGDVLNSIIEKYGTPSEVAAGYLEFEERLRGKVPSPLSTPKPFWTRFFGILAEPRAWGAFLYLIFSAMTGLIYTGWIVMGGLLSLSSLIFIIGIPIAAGFLLSLRGWGLIEGRIVEALLGERMPRKPLFIQQDLGWINKLKALFTDPLTWKIFVYMLLQFPLGLLYFLLIGGSFVLALSFIAAPIMELVFHLPLELLGTDTFTPGWLLPVVCAAGCLLVPLTLHLAKFCGRLQSRYAKVMLVRP